MLGRCPIVELRQYTVHAGARDVLADLFDRRFVAAQESVGIRVLGQFRDLDDPNRFVWLRGFADMRARREGLAGFYGGEAWKAYRDTANATMVDSDNVLLLTPAPGEPAPPPGRHEAGARAALPMIVATIHYVERESLARFAAFFDGEMRPGLQAAGLVPFAQLQSSAEINNYPALPVREEDAVFVWFSRAQDPHDHRRRRASFLLSDWRARAPAAVLRQLARKPEILMLAPTPGSRLR